MMILLVLGVLFGLFVILVSLYLLLPKSVYTQQPADYCADCS